MALTSSPEKAAHARQLGAEHVVDYNEEPRWARAVLGWTDGRGADVVVDNVGRASIGQSIRAAARGGRIMTVGNTSGPLAEIDIRFMFVKQLRWIGSTMGAPEDFRRMLAEVWAGRLRPVVDRVLPLADGVEATRILERGEQFGKLVLSI